MPTIDIRVVAEEHALATGLRVRADHRMVDRRARAPLLVGERVLGVAARAREVEVVDRAQPLEARLPRRAQPLVAPYMSQKCVSPPEALATSA
jgi:hypothetical protein